MIEKLSKLSNNFNNGFAEVAWRLLEMHCKYPGEAGRRFVPYLPGYFMHAERGVLQQVAGMGQAHFADIVAQVPVKHLLVAPSQKAGLNGEAGGKCLYGEFLVDVALHVVFYLFQRIVIAVIGGRLLFLVAHAYFVQRFEEQVKYDHLPFELPYFAGVMVLMKAAQQFPAFFRDLAGLVVLQWNVDMAFVQQGAERGCELQEEHPAMARGVQRMLLWLQGKEAIAVLKKARGVKRPCFQRYFTLQYIYHHGGGLRQGNVQRGFLLQLHIIQPGAGIMVVEVLGQYVAGFIACAGCRGFIEQLRITGFRRQGQKLKVLSL